MATHTQLPIYKAAYDLVQAYFDCRRTKRNSASALAFEARLERTLRTALSRIEHMPADEVFQAGNSYLGLIGQASHPHTDRARLANALLARGHCVKSDLTKIYRHGDSKQ